MELNKHENDQQEIGLQWKPIIGFVLCIMITAVSLWGAFYSGYSPKLLFMAVSVLSFTQAVQQLLQVQTQVN
ncbi:hypothetical protein LG329_17840 [Virgibacillus necropolis]|uniref:hypothetical protein n=1 Tax=Virgibacillus necropolis TaxID=163877 RepID=UPI0038511436